MDLVFNKKDSIPSDEFLGGFSRSIFGVSTKFEVGLIFKQSKRIESVVHNFLFDTGAFISYAPETILKNLDIKPQFEGKLYGIISKNECKVKTKVARVSFSIIDDEGHESKNLNAWVAFHHFPYGPYLLGMKDIIENSGFIKKMGREQLILQID